MRPEIEDHDLRTIRIGIRPAIDTRNQGGNRMHRRSPVRRRASKEATRGQVLRVWRTRSPPPGLPPHQSVQNAGHSSGDNCCRLDARPIPDSERVKKLERPMEPVAPADIKIVDTASECHVELRPENTVVISATTPYQLVRHLTAPITLADSIKTTAMVDLGAMGNFIHPRFVQEHELVTKGRTPLVVNNVNGRLLSRVNRQTEI